MFMAAYPGKQHACCPYPVAQFALVAPRTGPYCKLETGTQDAAALCSVVLLLAALHCAVTHALQLTCFAHAERL